MKTFSARTLIDDILLIVRNNNISESEDMSRDQILSWIMQYKAYLSKKENDCLCGLQFIKQKYNLCQAPYYYDKKYITTDKDISMVLQDIVKYIEYYNVLYTKEPLHLNKWSISLVDIK